MLYKLLWLLRLLWRKQVGPLWTILLAENGLARTQWALALSKTSHGFDLYHENADSVMNGRSSFHSFVNPIRSLLIVNYWNFSLFLHIHREHHSVFIMFQILKMFWKTYITIQIASTNPLFAPLVFSGGKMWKNDQQRRYCHDNRRHCQPSWFVLSRTQVTNKYSKECRREIIGTRNKSQFSAPEMKLAFQWRNVDVENAIHNET